MKSVIEIFKEITKIPHCSFYTKKLEIYIINFAKSCDFEVEVDKAKNILCYAKKRKIAFQSHYDMVCMGDAPKIELIEDGNILRAKNSSLGADNGMGVAMALYLMQKYDNFEALFTNDEEVGLIGASELELKLKSKKLINLDSEEEGNVFIGCAGGVDIVAQKKLKRKKYKQKEKFYRIEIVGMQGGHSGLDIDKNIKNSIKELFFYLSINSVKVVNIVAGEKTNSIPKYAFAIVSCKKKLLGSEHIKVTKLQENHSSYISGFENITNFILSFAQGVRAYDKKLLIPQDSINLATFRVDKKIEVEFFARSMSREGLERLKIETNAHLKLLNFRVKFKHEFASWRPEITPFTKQLHKLSKNEFKHSKYSAIHAGLECGIIKDKFPGMEIVSIGPNIYNPHSTNEYCEIESVERVTRIIEKIVKKLNN